MSITTRTGDSGFTGLMYNRRVSKTHPRVEAYASVDELNAALGMVRATADDVFVRDVVLQTQLELVIVMGELATVVEDLPRYVHDGFEVVTPRMTARLDGIVQSIETQTVAFKGWATPGANLHAASLDIARTTCRRAERRVCALQEEGGLENKEVIVYLNRLSDVLWLLARWVETRLEDHALDSVAGEGR